MRFIFAAAVAIYTYEPFTQLALQNNLVTTVETSSAIWPLAFMLFSFGLVNSILNLLGFTVDGVGCAAYRVFGWVRSGKGPHCGPRSYSASGEQMLTLSRPARPAGSTPLTPVPSHMLASEVENR